MNLKVRSAALLISIISLIFVGLVSIVSADTITSNSYSLATSLSKSSPVVNEPLNINLNLSTVGSGVSNGIFQVQVFNSNNVKVLS
ncbi:MAG TPA: hypothetical protein VK153_00960, partial [Candidatus Paceibacterota bacterium]|nr:hypothetical protein [Candidatus Paceibacterota bacterium]